MSNLDWKYVLCIECEDIEMIPKSWDQSWSLCFDCGMFIEAERLSNAK